MGIILILVAIVLFIATCVYFGNYENGRGLLHQPNAMRYSLITFVVGLAVATAICVFIMFISYDCYVDMKQEQVTVEQYASEVKAYAQFGVGSFMPGQMASQEITDFKFGEYQEELSRKLYGLRSEVESYNKTLICKKLRRSNWVFSALIYMPDEAMTMETISMSKLLKDVEVDDTKQI